MHTNPQQASDAETLLQTYGDMVYRLAFAQLHSQSDADDIFQEVFLRYFKNNPTFQSEEHRKAWLLRVTINCTKKHWSSAWQRKTVALEDHYVFEQPEENGLFEALGQLPPKYRSVIHLYYYEGYSTKEIAQLLGRRESTVRTQLTRSRSQLSQLLKGDE